jgi:hypothetical protein
MHSFDTGISYGRKIWDRIDIWCLDPEGQEQGIADSDDSLREDSNISTS